MENSPTTTLRKLKYSDFNIHTINANLKFEYVNHKKQNQN